MPESPSSFFQFIDNIHIASVLQNSLHMEVQEY